MKKILVVDDDAHLREVMNLTLHSMGYQAITAANGNEGVEKAISESPDLILLDIMLPDVDGRQVARLLRQHPAFKDIPIIAITGSFDTRRSCLNAGCNDFMSKPFTPELLEEKLRALTRN